MIFDTFFETCQNVWKSTKQCLALRGRVNLKGRLLQKQTNSAAKLQKIDANLRPEKNTRKNGSKI